MARKTKDLLNQIGDEAPTNVQKIGQAEAYYNELDARGEDTFSDLEMSAAQKKATQAPKAKVQPAKPKQAKAKTASAPKPRKARKAQNPVALKWRAMTLLNRVSGAPAVALKKARSQPRLLKMIGAGLAVLLVIGVVFASGVFGTPTIADLQEEVKENPKDADARMDLGHALFSKGKADRALRSYGKALALDSKAVDGELVDNLVASFGTKSQARAASLIARHKITDAEDELREGLENKRRSVRALALKTLERIKKATREDRLGFYLQDLSAKDCDTRVDAATKLGDIGDKQAISALKAADKKDKKETPWYKKSCLGDTAEDAVEKIHRKVAAK